MPKSILFQETTSLTGLNMLIMQHGNSISLKRTQVGHQVSGKKFLTLVKKLFRPVVSKYFAEPRRLHKSGWQEPSIFLKYNKERWDAWSELFAKKTGTSVLVYPFIDRMEDKLFKSDKNVTVGRAVKKSFSPVSRVSKSA